MHYAHSRPDDPTKLSWEPLEKHLREVAELAGQFAAKFGAQGWGELAGSWHDLGKYSSEFQAYIAGANGVEGHLESRGAGKVDHSTAGAQHADRSYADPATTTIGRLLAYCIAGHHAGLADWRVAGSETGLANRLKRKIPKIHAAPPSELVPPVVDFPHLQPAASSDRVSSFQAAFFCRMLFSCLVDADFLATERFYDPTKAEDRRGPNVTLADLAAPLEQKFSTFGPPQNHIQRCREKVRTACEHKAALPPGFFTLTVPTGGGKTLASLQFALRHAATHPHHGFHRIVYAIPFTSIIEQTAETFRAVYASLPSNVVLEHHCNLAPERETLYARLAAENWEAPLVVTTNVQFFESLYAKQPFRCRKLHNLVGSIIILDEAQTLPLELLKPCLDALRELVLNYKCTVVLCTATQPAILKSESFDIGLEAHCVREIIDDPVELYNKMRRVDTHRLGPVTDEELLDALGDHDSFLCIVNSRKHAARIFRRLLEQDPRSGDTTFHLSTWMCAEHRSEVIAKVRKRLNEEQPCRVVSTQLIEAGVDLDFPIVFRALSGIDAIAQAAGRCNRHGEADRGDVYVFDPTDAPPFDLLARTAHAATQIMPDYDDILCLDAVRHYFQLHYWRHEDLWDARGITRYRRRPGMFGSSLEEPQFDFATAAAAFRMIDNQQHQIIVPWGKEGQRIVDILLEDGPPPDRDTRRKMQRLTVGIHQQHYDALCSEGCIETRHEFYEVLISDHKYDKHMGIVVEDPPYGTDCNIV